MAVRCRLVLAIREYWTLTECCGGTLCGFAGSLGTRGSRGHSPQNKEERTMYKVACLLVVGAIALPTAAVADERPAPHRLRPAALFERLDANRDGQVTADEIPDGAPERLKSLLKRADKNADQKLTPDELAVIAPPIDPRAARTPASRPAQSRRTRAPEARREQRPSRPSGRMLQRGGLSPHRGTRRGLAAETLLLRGGAPRMPNPEMLFDRLDRDQDGKLSLEEFTAGMRAVHARPGPPFGRPGTPPALGRTLGPPCPPMGGPPFIRPPMGRPFGLMAGEAFKRVDANRDGKLSLDEVPLDRQERFKHFLARADRDGDKAISLAEARRVGAAIRARAGMLGPLAQKPGEAKQTPEAKKRAAKANRQKEAAAKKAAARKAAQVRKKRAEARKKAAAAKKAAAKAETRK